MTTKSIGDAESAGLVLAAGRARRFGADKALAVLAGRTLLERACDVLGQVTPHLAISLRPGSDAEALAARLGLTAVYDALEIGPLAGVASGLQWAKAATWLLTLPCDTALVPEGAYERLLAAARKAGAAYALTPDGAQSLCAVWPTAFAPRLAAMLAEGRHPSVLAVLAELNAEPVRFEEGFVNVNTREDLAAAEAAWRAKAQS